jgi:Na+/proline symporter
MTLGLMVVSGVITYYLKSVEGAWKFLLAIGAGTGLVYLLRWYWWRVNAWSEVSAMAAALVVSLSLQFGVGLDPDDPHGFAWLMLLTVGVTTGVWLAVTFATPPEPDDHLRRFCRRVRPGGPGWARIDPDARDAGPGASGLLSWAAGCVIVYLGLFGLGSLLLQRPLRGLAFVAVAALLGVWVVRRAGLPPAGGGL